jgi:hypothetical protein
MITPRAIAVLTLCLCMLSLSSAAAKGPVILNVTVPPGQWKALKLRNLPKGAFVAVEIESSGDITVAFVDTSDYRKLPHPKRPLMLGKVEKRLAFSVSIPAAGNYFVVLTNHRATGPHEVRLTVSAARGSMDQREAADKILRTFERKLHRIFVFDPFPIGVEKCGVPKAFAETSGIVLCAEYIYHLYDTINDKEKTKDALSFSLFHEVGHILLATWNYPFSASIEVADEFATALMVMLNQKERAAGAAGYIVENPSVGNAMIKLFQNERHPLSLDRARSVQRWVEDPQLARRWQKVLVPHMQTALLKRLLRQPTVWTDLPLVEKELKARGHSAPKYEEGVPSKVRWNYSEQDRSCSGTAQP